ncbi:MAG: HAMP domain-containing sensor histidine kinase [Phycisphaerales bacterium]|nr:HAMP domain-containing sensor histidine kinase [Phycisphaerales bacterium]
MSSAKTRGISLANKCLILFGCALAVILILALATPWIRTDRVVADYQLEVAQQLAKTVIYDDNKGISRPISMKNLVTPDLTDPTRPDEPDLVVGYLDWFAIESNLPPTEAQSLTMEQDIALEFKNAFTEPDPKKYVFLPERITGTSIYVYAQPIPRDKPISTSNVTGPTMPTDGPVTPRGLAIVLRSTQFGEGLLSTSRVLILIAGLVAIVVAMIVFRLMLARLIFRPVTRLQSVIEQVTEGNLEARSKIRTGDELELLSTGLDDMLNELTETQDRLQRMNENLDLKVAELAEANVGLWESTRFKTEFLANISHELRTPLNSIIGFTELLHDQALAEEELESRRVRYLTNILNSSRSLLDMINELLDMAKIEAGRMEVNVEPTSLGDVIELLMRAMSPQAEARGIKLVSDLQKDLPVVETDPGKVQQILYNLLSNAVKFSPDNGTIRITAATGRSEKNTGSSEGVIVSVADEGPGIPADMHDIIFEKFRQVDASHTRTHMGTGLGLAICRDLADMLHGELWLKSIEGKGATFFLSLDVLYRNKVPQSLMSDQ